jgi:FtsZ-binding cell division protein ZapB
LQQEQQQLQQQREALQRERDELDALRAGVQHLIVQGAGVVNKALHITAAQQSNC